MTSWRAERREVAHIARWTVEELAEADGLQVLDVRELSEWREGHIPGSLHSALPRPARAAERDRPGAARRGDLRLGPAQRDRRQPPVRTRRARGDPRG